MRTAIGTPDRGQPVEEPTARQLRCLRAMTEITGTTFATPKTKREASAMITAMHRRRRSLPSEIRNERQEVSEAIRAGRSDATRIRPCELRGYGSNASWRRG
jgi:hypothetical protein